MYMVIELQTGSNGATTAITEDYAERAEAESKFHQILTFAATSTVPVHSALVMNPEGTVLKKETYKHTAEEA
jgi:hypothetical protein